MNVAMFITNRDKDSAILRGCRDKEGPTKSKAERKGKKICKDCGLCWRIKQNWFGVTMLA
jgi:hypothetical protein